MRTCEAMSAGRDIPDTERQPGISGCYWPPDQRSPQAIPVRKYCRWTTTGGASQPEPVPNGR